MIKKELIELFERLMPQDLKLKCPNKGNDEEIDAYNDVKAFLLEEAAKNYFNLFIKPVLAKQIELQKSDGEKLHELFSTDWCCGKEVMDKYINMLDPEDELKTLYDQHDINKTVPIDTLRTYGII